MEIPGGAKIICDYTEDECKLREVEFIIRTESPDEGYRRLINNVKEMSGLHRLAASELSTGANAKLKGEAYLNMVEEEMLSDDEGSKKDMAEDVAEGEEVKVDNLGK